MANPIWPAGLPQKLRATGYSESPPKVLIHSQTATGPAKIRRRNTANIAPVSGQVLVSSAQLSSFETFFNVTLLGGSLAFDWVHPRTGAAATLRFTADGPSWVKIGGDNWLLTLPMEVLP